jgi:hypothetical protein
VLAHGGRGRGQHAGGGCPEDGYGGPGSWIEPSRRLTCLRLRPLPSWFDYYDQSRLDGFWGYSYQVFGKLDAAQSCLEGAVAALPERCAKQRSVVLTDLATVHLRNNEVEEACRTAGTAVQALQRAGYATGTHRLREFRWHVEPWKRHRAVRMLDDQMSAI